MDVPAPAEKANLPFLHLFVLFSLSMDWIMHTTLVKVIIFTQSAESPTDRAGNTVIPAFLASYSQVAIKN